MKQLAELIAQYSRGTPPAQLEPLRQELHARYGDSLLGFVFYGSCLRQEGELEGIVDLYVIVSGYREAFDGIGRRVMARILPPTVGYLETSGGPVIRAKYAVISLRDFQRGTSSSWFHSYLWGRFAQPCLLLDCKNEPVRQQLEDCLATAVVTFLNRSLPLAPVPTDSTNLWTHALSLSYGTELRPESPARAMELVLSDEDYYREAAIGFAADSDLLSVSCEGAGASPVFTVECSGWRRRIARLGWGVRRISGKMLTIARLFKALGTFDGGLDYAVWKLERHSGVEIVLSEKTRRRPWLYVWGELLRLYRSGALR